MLENIKSKDIDIKISCNDWRDCILKCTQNLIRQEKVKKEYADAIIKSIEDNGPYLVISKGIALSHARPESGVIDNGITVATLEEPIEFGAGENDPVELVITLAAKDPDTHIELLGELAGVLSSNNVVKELIDAKNSEDFLQILKENQ